MLFVFGHPWLSIPSHLRRNHTAVPSDDAEGLARSLNDYALETGRCGGRALRFDFEQVFRGWVTECPCVLPVRLEDLVDATSDVPALVADHLGTAPDVFSGVHTGDDDTGFFSGANHTLTETKMHPRDLATAQELMAASGRARAVCDGLWNWMLDEQRTRLGVFRERYAHLSEQSKNGAVAHAENVEFGSHAYMLRVRRAHASASADPNTPQSHKDGSAWGSVYTDWGSAAHSPWPRH